MFVCLKDDKTYEPSPSVKALLDMAVESIQVFVHFIDMRVQLLDNLRVEHVVTKMADDVLACAFKLTNFRLNLLSLFGCTPVKRSS